MSVWTHVAGVIRVDCIRCISKPEFDKIFIKSLWDEHNPDCNMPMGSEGSLDFRIIENPNKDSLAAYTVVIFGDLRNFGAEDIHKIEKWWDKVLEQCGMIRQAILQIQPGDGDVKILEQKDVK